MQGVVCPFSSVVEHKGFEDRDVDGCDTSDFHTETAVPI